MPIRTTSGWKLTYDDYAAIPDDGRRHEIIDGEHLVSAAPTPTHQTVSGRLYLVLAELERDGRGRVLYSPIDVQLSPFDIVQPDLIAVATASAHRIGPVKIDGPPELVVEILSPSTAALDRGRKRELYERSGVLEYWIVDPAARTLAQHVLSDGRFAVRVHDRGEVESTAFRGLSFDLASQW